MGYIILYFTVTIQHSN